MIVKGKSRSGPGALAAHLGNAEKNERVSLLEIRGTVANDLRGALVEMDAYAVGTRCEKSLYHAAISPEPPHRLTPEQREEAVNALETKLGLDGHARVVVLHEKLGREHIHVVWSRIDLENMRSVSDSHNYRKHEEAARDLERRFGHERVQGAHHERDGIERPERTPSRAELRQEERTGIKGKDVRADVTGAFKSADNAQAFQNAVEDMGYVLAKGDRRDFVIVDRAGGIHSLARRIEGMHAAQLREFMSPLDRDGLPSIEEARQIAKDRNDPELLYQKNWDEKVAEAAIAKVKDEQNAKRARGEKDRDPAVVEQMDWEDRLAESAVRKAKDLDEDEKRRKRDVEDGADLGQAYGHGDGYVQQSSAALEHHMQRQERLNEKHEEERLRRQADEATQQQSANADASTTTATASPADGIEMTDARQDALSRLADASESKPPRDDPGRQRGAPDGGRTRSR